MRTTFQEDGRLPIQDLYASYDKLINEFGWKREIVYTQEEELPTLVLTSPQTGPAFWILAGVHGEEPAGPNAIAQNIQLIAHLGSQVPVVLFPLCNPLGYTKDWRYPNEWRDWKKGHSVADAEYLLPQSENSTKSRTEKASSPESFALTSKVLELIKNYPPLISIDHHEDEALEESYIYSQGEMGREDPVAKRIIQVLKQSGVPIQMEGTTRFSEEVREGIIGPVQDGSIDELLAAQKIIIDSKVVQGPSAKTAIVIETPTKGTSLKMRVAAHSQVIQSYLLFYTTLLEHFHLE